MSKQRSKSKQRAMQVILTTIDPSILDEIVRCKDMILGAKVYDTKNFRLVNWFFTMDLTRFDDYICPVDVAEFRQANSL